MLRVVYLDEHMEYAAPVSLIKEMQDNKIYYNTYIRIFSNTECHLNQGEM